MSGNMGNTQSGRKLKERHLKRLQVDDKRSKSGSKPGPLSKKNKISLDDDAQNESSSGTDVVKIIPIEQTHKMNGGGFDQESFLKKPTPKLQSNGHVDTVKKTPKPGSKSPTKDLVTKMSAASTPFSILKWKPASNGSALRANPEATPQTNSALKSVGKKDSQKHKYFKANLGNPVAVKTGPRARLPDDDTLYFGVESILKKWVGCSDRTDKDVFYLVQFKGVKKIDVSRASSQTYKDFWVHSSCFLECEDMIANADQDFEASKKKKKKGETTRKSRGWVYVSEDEDEDKVPKKPVVVDEVEGKRLRSREDTQSVSKSKPKKVYETKREPTCLDKGLKPIEIIAGHLNDKQQLSYFVEFEGGMVDVFSTHTCREKLPELLIDYLLKQFTIPTFDATSGSRKKAKGKKKRRKRPVSYTRNDSSNEE